MILGSDSAFKVIQKLRCRIDTGHQQVITWAGAGNVEKVSFRIVNLFEIGVICDRLDPLLKRNDLVITGHNSDSAKLKTFGKVHRADRN